MNLHNISEGLLGYLLLLILLTFHEAAHAWTAWKCGDDTARLQGRVSLNPLVHMDLLGTVILPLAVIFLRAVDSALANFIIGWGKPVPVDINNLRHRRLDDVLVALAGPAMNFALAAGLVALSKGFDVAGVEAAAKLSVQTAIISLVLCFFNLLPVPPLDGSHVLKNAVGMSDEYYWRLCRFGFIAVILLLQAPWVRYALEYSVLFTLDVFARATHLPASHIIRWLG